MKSTQNIGEVAESSDDKENGAKDIDDARGVIICGLGSANRSLIMEWNEWSTDGGTNVLGGTPVHHVIG